MATLYKNRRIATLIHKQTPYRGEWLIYQYHDHNYRACHEVEQSHGERKVVETLKLKSLAEAQAFSIYLGSHGWSRLWQP
jgi:hypothetical protein